MDLIYCASKNRAFDQAALDAGFLLGARLPCSVYLPIQFADQDWKRPSRAAYMAALAEYRPMMATVMDIESFEQIAEALDWAEEAAQFVRVVLLIPKAGGLIARLPDHVNGVEVRLAYSVPTRYSGAQVLLSEFGTRPVHLLGGSPQAQMRLRYYVNVTSADGNMHNRMAMLCRCWVPGTARMSRDRYWPKLSELNVTANGNGPLTAFTLSCQNIMAAWKAGQR